MKLTHTVKNLALATLFLASTAAYSDSVADNRQLLQYIRNNDTENALKMIHEQKFSLFKNKDKKLFLEGSVDGVSPLTGAIRQGQIPIIKALLNRGADPTGKVTADLIAQSSADSELQSMDFDNPLMLAARSGETEIVQLLIEKKVDLDSKGQADTALRQAISRGQLKVAELLIKNGASLKKTGTAIGTLGSRADRELFATFEQLAPFLTQGKKGTVDINAKNNGGKTVLANAVSKNQTNMVKLILEKKPDINMKNNHQDTPLWDAVGQNNLEITKLLIMAGADVNGTSWEKTTLLHRIMFHPGGIGLAKLLIASGADINAKDRSGDTPLHKMIANNNTSKADFLLEAGADPNIKNKIGYTPLYSVINSDDRDATPNYKRAMVKMLIENGADINAKNGISEETALHEAINHNDASIVQLLLSEHADINVKHKKGIAPWMLAAAGKNPVIKDLIAEAQRLDQLKARAPKEQFESKEQTQSAENWKAKAAQREEKRAIANALEAIQSGTRGAATAGRMWGAGETAMNQYRTPEMTVSVNLLDQRYPQAIPNTAFAVHSIKQLVRGFNTVKNQTRRLKKEAALRFLDRVTNEEFRGILHEDTHLTLPEYLALSWYAINDSKLYPSEKDKADRQWAFIEAMANIQRAHNDNQGKSPIIWEPRQPDMTSCVPGSFVRSVEHLDRNHPDVVIIKITNEEITSLIREKNGELFPAYSKNLNSTQMQHLAESAENYNLEAVNQTKDYTQYKDQLKKAVHKAIPEVPLAQIERLMSDEMMCALITESNSPAQ